MVVDLYKKFRKGTVSYKKGLKLHDDRGMIYEPDIWNSETESQIETKGKK
ncbi:hypothetical protein KAJ27_25850 [bacterium]|nr:hypothetical protein [bacterium]